MRTFLAYILPIDILNSALEAKNSLTSLNHRDIKWVEDVNLHVTLQFLGEVNENKLQEIDGVISEMLLTAPAAEFEIQGIEASPAAQPRVIWIKLECSPERIKFHQKLASRLKQHCPEIEIKPFKPHITLGRVKDNIPPIILTKMLSYPIKQQKFISDEIVLFKSILSKKGPQYIPLNEYVSET
jgi:2'-5' RNA ligase